METALRITGNGQKFDSKHQAESPPTEAELHESNFRVADTVLSGKPFQVTLHVAQAAHKSASTAADELVKSISPDKSKADEESQSAPSVVLKGSSCFSHPLMKKPLAALLTLSGISMIIAAAVSSIDEAPTATETAPLIMCGVATTLLGVWRGVDS